MKKIDQKKAMTGLIATTALLALMSGPVAIAQTGTGSSGAANQSAATRKPRSATGNHGPATYLRRRT